MYHNLVPVDMLNSLKLTPDTLSLNLEGLHISHCVRGKGLTCLMKTRMTRCYFPKPACMGSHAHSAQVPCMLPLQGLRLSLLHLEHSPNCHSCLLSFFILSPNATWKRPSCLQQLGLPPPLLCFSQHLHPWDILGVYLLICLLLYSPTPQPGEYKLHRQSFV